MGDGNFLLCNGISSLGGNMGMVSGYVGGSIERLAVGRYGLSGIHYIERSRQIHNFRIR